MKKKLIVALMFSLMNVQHISAAELIEKEPVKIQAEEMPAIAEEENDFQPQSQEQSEQIEKWKNAVRMAAPDTSDMAKTVQNPNTGTEFSVYCKKGEFGFYYDESRFILHEVEISEPDYISEIVLKSKDSADTRSEIMIQYQETDEDGDHTPENIKDYYNSILAESTQTDNRNTETNAEITEEQNNSSDSLFDDSDAIPVIGSTQLGANNVPAFFVQTGNSYRHEEYYVVATENGCYTITLTAPVTDSDKLEEAKQILQSMIIEHAES